MVMMYPVCAKKKQENRINDYLKTHFFWKLEREDWKLNMTSNYLEIGAKIHEIQSKYFWKSWCFNIWFLLSSCLPPLLRAFWVPPTPPFPPCMQRSNTLLHSKPFWTKLFILLFSASSRIVKPFTAHWIRIKTYTKHYSTFHLISIHSFFWFHLLKNWNVTSTHFFSTNFTFFFFSSCESEASNGYRRFRDSCHRVFDITDCLQPQWIFIIQFRSGIWIDHSFQIWLRSGTWCQYQTISRFQLCSTSTNRWFDVKRRFHCSSLSFIWEK